MEKLLQFVTGATIVGTPKLMLPATEAKSPAGLTEMESNKAVPVMEPAKYAVSTLRDVK